MGAKAHLANRGSSLRNLLTLPETGRSPIPANPWASLGNYEWVGERGSLGPRTQTCWRTSGLSHGRTLTLYFGKSWTARCRCPWLIMLRLLRRPDRKTFPSVEIRMWLALTLLQGGEDSVISVLMLQICSLQILDLVSSHPYHMHISASHTYIKVFMNIFKHT